MRAVFCRTLFGKRASRKMALLQPARRPESGKVPNDRQMGSMPDFRRLRSNGSLWQAAWPTVSDVSPTTTPGARPGNAQAELAKIPSPRTGAPGPAFGTWDSQTSLLQFSEPILTQVAPMRGSPEYLITSRPQPRGLPPPVAFNKHPAARPACPVGGNPDPSWPRRTPPMAAHPHIAGAIPAVIAANPDPAAMRSRAVALHDGRGRRHPNENTRLGH
jgi:hypothetical protein